MKRIALPVVDTGTNRNLLASGLSANGCVCLFDIEANAGSWMKITALASNMGELLPALEALDVSVIITLRMHPMALKILSNKGFDVYKATSDQLPESISSYQQSKLERYSHEASMELASVCGGECTSCSTGICDDEKKS